MAIAADAAVDICRNLLREPCLDSRSNGGCMILSTSSPASSHEVKHMARFLVYLSVARFPLLTEGSGATFPSVTKGACYAPFWTNTVTTLSFKRWLSLGASLLITSGLPGAGRARERGPRVEVVCPQRPIPFPLDKHTVLAYELHITNFDDVPLALKRIRVFSDANDAEGLLEI